MIGEDKIVNELSNLKAILELPLNEATWMKHEKAIFQLKELIISNPGITHQNSLILSFLKKLSGPLLLALKSDRTKLSGTCTDFLEKLVADSGQEFRPFLSIFVPVLLKQCLKSSKIIVHRAQECISAMVMHCRQSELLSFLLDSLRNPNKNLRISAMQNILLILKTFETRQIIPHKSTLEISIPKCLGDSDPQVRELSRSCLKEYCNSFSDRKKVILNSLDPTQRKYLELSSVHYSNSKPSLSVSGQSSGKEDIPYQSNLSKSTSSIVSLKSSIEGKSHQFTQKEVQEIKRNKKLFSATTETPTRITGKPQRIFSQHSFSSPLAPSIDSQKTNSSNILSSAGRSSVLSHSRRRPLGMQNSSLLANGKAQRVLKPSGIPRPEEKKSATSKQGSLSLFSNDIINK